MFMIEGSNKGSRLGEALGQGIQKGTSDALKFSREMQLREAQKKEDKRDLGETFGTILDEMKGLIENVGPYKLAALNPFSETSGKRSQINTLRLSLEGLFRDLTLKGQFPKAIYERILKEIPQASDTPQQYLNKIEGVEKILHSHYKEKSGKDKTSSKKEMFDASKPEHKAKATQLHKTFGDREKVREKLRLEFEGV